MIWTFKQERNCCTISVCYSGCEMTPRRDSFARRQPPIQPVLDASFLLMQRSGTHALCVKLTGSHLPVLPVLLRAYCIVYGGKNQAEINIFLLIPAIFSCLSRNVGNAASNLLSIIQLSLQISRLYLTSQHKSFRMSMMIDMIFRFFSYIKQEKRLREQRRLVPSRPFSTSLRRPPLWYAPPVTVQRICK